LFFLPESDKLYVLFQCLEHARQNDLSRSFIGHTLYHSLNQVRQWPGKLAPPLKGQDKANHQANHYCYQKPHFLHCKVSFPRCFDFWSYCPMKLRLKPTSLVKLENRNQKLDVTDYA
jgi:hypothetical protein